MEDLKLGYYKLKLSTITTIIEVIGTTYEQGDPDEHYLINVISDKKGAYCVWSGDSFELDKKTLVEYFDYVPAYNTPLWRLVNG